MIIPEYWAESRVQYRVPKKQVTVRRFGWSNESQAAAQAHADERASEALQRAIHDAAVPRRDQKIPYNGADGLPIREEVILREDRFVITRNSYGALCINSPDVLFADVDLAWRKDFGWKELIVLQLPFLVVLAISVAITGSFLVALMLQIVFCIAWAILRSLHNKRLARSGYFRKLAADRIHKFAMEHPDWSLRVYQTPAGYRVLVTHRTFAPDESDVESFFTAIRVDPIYERMCRNQQCFRARLTAKPWRIGINSHMRPRPGVWPVHPDRLLIRNAWIEVYQAAAKNFAACEFIESLGSQMIHADVQAVLEIHDRLSQANTKLPIA